MDIPLVYTFVNAFKPLEEFFVFPPRFYVIHPTLENFSDLSKLLSNMWVPLSRYLFNSVFVSAVATVGCIVFTVMAAFVITKHDIPGKKLIDFLIVNAILFTGKVIGVPQYIVLSSHELDRQLHGPAGPHAVHAAGNVPHPAVHGHGAG